MTASYRSVFRPGLFAGRTILVTITPLEKISAKGWGQVAAPRQAQQRDAVKPFDGFHRYVAPKVFET